MSRFGTAPEVEATDNKHGGISHIPHPNGTLMASMHPDLNAAIIRYVLDIYDTQRAAQ